MRYLWILVLTAAFSWSQTASISSVNSTTAILVIRGATGACTLALSESSMLSPLHPDVDNAKYSGAGTDTGRPDTITRADGSRLVTLGHSVSDRSLAASTAYYWGVSGCGTTVTGQFATPTLSNVTYQRSMPFDAAQWGNQGFPTNNLTDNTNWRVDPLSGVSLKPINTSGHWTWRTNAGNPMPLSDYDKGSGWTNASSVLNGSTSTATTSNTNPLEVYFQYLFWVYAQYWGNLTPWSHVSLDDLGVVLWGNGTDASAANRTVQICLFQDPSGTASAPRLT